jgi:RIO kinase 1
VRTHIDFDDSFPDERRPFEKRRRGKTRFDDAGPRRRGRLTEEAKTALTRELDDATTDLPDGDRWSTWVAAEHGPAPRPDWVVTAAAATDTELGVLKSGKEADVHLIRRAVPGTDGCVVAAKRYRGADHRMFHRDSGYLEGRRMRRSREMRAMANRTAYGRNLIAEQWSAAEFAALSRLWDVGVPVPYPVQRDGTELLMEFIGDEVAAPRLAQVRVSPAEWRELWWQLRSVLFLLAGEGLTHGDLSAYNILVHNGQLVLIDLPQLVDLVANPNGVGFLARDVRNVAGFFAARGVDVDTEELIEELADEAR